VGKEDYLYLSEHFGLDWTTVMRFDLVLSVWEVISYFCPLQFSHCFFVSWR